MGTGLPLRGRHKDGRELPVEISLSPLTAGDGQWVIAAIRDDRSRPDVERERRDVAVSDTRDGIARDLGDTVIRSLFGTGLHLHSLLEQEPARLRAGVHEAIGQIDRTILELRPSIFRLRDTT